MACDSMCSQYPGCLVVAPGRHLVLTFGDVLPISDDCVMQHSVLHFVCLDDVPCTMHCLIAESCRYAKALLVWRSCQCTHDVLG
jgi:hypothetical protein